MKGDVNRVTVIILTIMSATIFSSTAIYSAGFSFMIHNLKNDGYINYFPYHLSKNIDNETKIALTEAGRFAYWVNGKKYDLVGLNTPETAVNGSSPAYIEGLNPDLIFIHVVETADYSKVCNKNYCELSYPEVLNGIKKDTDWRVVKYGVTKAPLTVYDYLKDKSDDYQAFSVSYDNSYPHLYFIKKDGNIDIDDFKEALNLSFSEKGVLSYWDMKKKLGFSSIFE
ncbi:hypothetical protein GCM10011450_19510 [Advenella faeciporci]|uniref:Uncharacterized protein n=2 Tax=Advenella faeciporci TaxID=797535 RepID=A0A918JM67_9BURK|nr:hypothetical protein GCM10011450_19510 [Advenella faeciporci]